MPAAPLASAAPRHMTRSKLRNGSYCLFFSARMFSLLSLAATCERSLHRTVQTPRGTVRALTVLQSIRHFSLIKQSLSCQNSEQNRLHDAVFELHCHALTEPASEGRGFAARLNVSLKSGFCTSAITENAACTSGKCVQEPPQRSEKVFRTSQTWCLMQGSRREGHADSEKRGLCFSQSEALPEDPQPPL